MLLLVLSFALIFTGFGKKIVVIFLCTSLIGGLSVSAFVLIHTGHEGSHAAMGHFIQKGEAILDNELNCLWEKCTSSEMGHIVDVVTRSPRPVLERMLREKNVTMPHWLKNDKFWAQTVRTAFVRLPLAQLCALRETDIRVMLRSDIMRWSLSNTFLDGDDRWPEFHKPESITHTRRYYPIKLVKAAAIDIAGRLLRIKNTVIGLAKCGKHVTIIHYEMLEDSGVLDDLTSMSGVSRVHGHRISDFVSNYDKIYQHFLEYNYAPKFDEWLKLNVSYYSPSR